MTFLNAILLGGLFAGAIPIVIHIINRNRFRRIDWGAMHLLEQILRTQRRRLRIEQLLLLLVRTAIPILLALCMARPVLTGMRALLGKAKTSMVILLDDSYSMNAVSGSQSRFAQAKAQVREIVESLPGGSEVYVGWLCNRGDGIGPSFDRRKVLASLAARKEGYGMARPAEALEAGAAVLSKAHYVDRELVVVSDFQGISWSEDQTEARGRSMDLIENLPIEPPLTLLRGPAEEVGNVAVESLEVSRAVLGVGQKVMIRVNLVNHGSAAIRDMRVYLRVDGQNQDASQITLDPRQEGQVVFTHKFTTAGSHVLEAYAEADALKTDNVMRHSVSVWDQLELLLVSGDTNPKPLESETAFLQIALQPFTSATAASSDLIRASVVTPDRIKPDLVAGNRVVVLANVPRLSDSQVNLLKGFVEAGGGLLVFAGDRIDVEWYNQRLAPSQSPLLPCEVANLVTVTDEDDEAARIVAQHYDHPALEFFNDPRNGSLSGMKIHTRYGLRPRTAAMTRTLAHLDSGEPFMVEHAFGQGRVIQCCTACDDDWSNLPMRPSYLPLMQQLVTYLASTVYPPRNLDVGDKAAALLGPGFVGQSMTMTDPEGRQHTLEAVAAGYHSLVEYTDTYRPGLYVLQTPDEKTVHFVVNASRQESQIKVLEDEKFEALAEEMGARAVSSSADYLKLDRQRRFGREIWKPLLAAILFLILAELLLQQRFSRVRR